MEEFLTLWALVEADDSTIRFMADAAVLLLIQQKLFAVAINIQWF